MNGKILFIALFFVVGFFSGVHAQEAGSEPSITETPLLVEEYSVVEATPLESVTETVAEVLVNEVADKIVPATSESTPVREPVSERRRRASPTTVLNVTIESATEYPCWTNATTGISSCPKTIEPCLAGTDCSTPPIDEKEKPVEPSTDVPLFSFNPLWVASTVSLSPTTGSGAESPVAVVPVSETGPDPAIVAQADGRSLPAVMEEIPATPVSTAGLTGLFSGANLPWLGLLVLLMIGILVWRGKGN